jgi:hypothetical protein
MSENISFTTVTLTFLIAALALAALFSGTGSTLTEMLSAAPDPSISGTSSGSLIWD